jgi:hypothetical protein
MTVCAPRNVLRCVFLVCQGNVIVTVSNKQRVLCWSRERHAGTLSSFAKANRRFHLARQAAPPRFNFLRGWSLPGYVVPLCVLVRWNPLAVSALRLWVLVQHSHDGYTYCDDGDHRANRSTVVHWILQVILPGHQSIRWLGMRFVAHMSCSMPVRDTGPLEDFLCVFLI